MDIKQKAKGEKGKRSKREWSLTYPLDGLLHTQFDRAGWNLLKEVCLLGYVRIARVGATSYLPMRVESSIILCFAPLL